ncbi:MAG: FAD-dependent oxidoreductase [Desulfobacterales bacterium]|nr:FAD-dependent oxidoreductase [Desulfobacterales bacterium]
MSAQLPTQAQIVIIGGGIVGCSTAYHLTRHGYTDVVLLERKELGSGTTWAAAGLVAQLRQNQEMTNLAKYATELYAKLEAETGVATGYVTTGALGVCQTEDRRREWLRGSAMAGAFGIEMYEISLKEAEDMVPGMSAEGLVSAFYLPKDGQTNPLETTQALAKGARMEGAQIFENTLVTDIKVKDGAICGVSTDAGEIACEIVINCAGMWGREVGKMVKVSLPLAAAEHMHAITKPIEGMPTVFPCVRDFDGRTYFKSEVGGILFGGFEAVAKPWGMKGIPGSFKFTELSEDWDQFEEFMECGLQRFPALEEAEVRHLSVVPESFTPDNAFMVGEAPGIKNFFVGCGMNSVGIASAAGVGRAIAQWVDQGYPEEQLWPVDVRRYFPWQQNNRYVHDRVVESVGILYEHHYPNRQRTTARPVICSPLHDRLKDNRAAFSMIAGWERADWFAPEGVDPVYAYDWRTPNWLPYQKAEHLAVREAVGMYDLTSMGKYLVQGSDAEAVLQKICAGNMAVAVGQVVYTPVLNAKGGFETDITVTRVGEDAFFVVTAAGTVIRDFDYIKRRIPADARATITDVTHGYAMLAVMGPEARNLLQNLTDADLSNEGFPFRTGREIDLAYARPLALRISYVGELGWEFYIPSNFALGVFDAIMAEGEKFGLKLVGMQAVNSLRMECGYRHWENDITPEDTPLEAGLAFAVDFNKGDFVGQDALLAQKQGGLVRKMVQFTLDNPEAKLYQNEPIYQNGEQVSQITSGAYGFKVGSAVGMGYLKNPDGITNDWILDGQYEIMVEGERIPAKVHLRSPYDPQNERTRL